MVNLIAGKEVVPELVQHDFSAENVVARLNEIIPDGSRRSKIAHRAGQGASQPRRSHGRGPSPGGSRGGSGFGCAGYCENLKNTLNLVLPAIFASQSSSDVLAYLFPESFFDALQPRRARRALFLYLACSILSMSLPGWPLKKCAWETTTRSRPNLAHMSTRSPLAQGESLPLLKISMSPPSNC